MKGGTTTTDPESGGVNARFARNVAFAWGGYLVNVVSGFVVPRLISERLGQELLGVWDFSWTLVCYFGLVQLGVGGSVGRYVARHRASGDVTGLNRAISTIAVFQRCVGWLAFGLAVFVAWQVVPCFAGRLGPQTDLARQLLIIQGAEVAAAISLAVYGSVITGCHRWDLHNTVSAVAYLIVGAGMVITLVMGWGLPGLASVHAVGMTGAELVRRRLVRSVCPELVISSRLASWQTFVGQVRYSLKTLVPSVANLLSNQALGLLIAGFLGPASLAVFSRARSLVTMLRTLGAKFGMIVVPIASELEAREERAQLRRTLAEAPALMSAIAMPVTMAMAVSGNHLMRLWMGDAYVLPGLIGILSVAAYVGIVQEPVWCLLAGLDRHGKVAAAKLCAAVLAAAALAVGLAAFEWGLIEAAVCFVVPQLLVDGILTPMHACRVVGVGVGGFYQDVCLRPALRLVPFAVALTALVMLPSRVPGWLAATCWVGVIGGGLLYLKWYLPSSWKQWFAEASERAADWDRRGIGMDCGTSYRRNL